MNKVKLSGIKKMLSRDEMKRIVGGGCGSGVCGSKTNCQGGCDWTNNCICIITAYGPACITNTF
jgi:hypothetical protein